MHTCYFYQKENGAKNDVIYMPREKSRFGEERGVYYYDLWSEL